MSLDKDYFELQSFDHASNQHSRAQSQNLRYF